MSGTREHLDDWLARGLVDEATHATLVADLDRVEAEDGDGPETVEAEPAVVDDPAADQLLRVGAAIGLEAFGYLGAAFATGAAVILLDVPSWPDPALALLLAIVAVVAGAGAWRLADATDTALRRLSSVLVAVATLSAAGAAGMTMATIDPVDRRFGGDYRRATLVTTAVAVAVAAPLYRRVRRAVAHLALGGAVAALVAAYTDAALENLQVHWETESAAFSIVFLAAGLGWVVASEAGLLPPAVVGTVAGTLVGAGGIVGLADRSDWWTFLGLAVAAGYLATGVLREQPRLSVLGGVGVLAWLPATLTGPLGLTRTGTAAVLLPVGIVLLLMVLRWTRHTAHGTDSAAT